VKPKPRKAATPVPSGPADERTAIVLSILPQHSERIFRGSKKYELRKVLPRSPFQRVYLYEVGTGGIAGCFDVAGVVSGPVDKLWAVVGERATPQERFRAYFAASRVGYAIEISNPVRFDVPLAVQDLRGTVPSFRPPMGFRVVRARDPLFDVLELKRAKELDGLQSRMVRLEPIRDGHRAAFIKNVTALVSANYDGITADFARNLLRVHDLRHDDKGFLTVSKVVLSAMDQGGQLVGFTVLTEKRGGSAKTGPTFLLPQFQEKGLGRALRAAVEELARARLVRKLYCTVPATSIAAIRHLLRTGYRVEAHLERHYTVRHGELVFGKVLAPGHNTNRSPSEVPERIASVAASGDLLVEQTVSGLMGMFAARFVKIPRRTMERIVRGADKPGGGPEAKPRDLICLRNGEKCVGAAVLIPKRGGAVKCVVLLNTSHRASVLGLVSEVERRCRSTGIRKLFLVHPLEDSGFLRVLREAGFESEGILREPYRAGTDEIVLAKLFL